MYTVEIIGVYFTSFNSKKTGLEYDAKHIMMCLNFPKISERIVIYIYIDEWMDEFIKPEQVSSNVVQLSEHQSHQAE